MGDKDIEANVTIIAAAFFKGIKIKEEDKPVVKAVVDLVTNLLQNINDIANAS